MSTVREIASGWEDDDLRYEPPPGAATPVNDRNAWVRQSSAVVQATSAAEASGRSVRTSAAVPANTPANDVDPAEAEDEWEDAEDWDEAEEWEHEQEARPVRRRRHARSRGATDTALIRRSRISFVMVSLVRGALLAMLVGSFFGSVATFNPEGIDPILRAFPWLRPFAETALVTGAHPNALLIGVVAQLWITGIEYWKAPKRLTLRGLFRPENWCYSAHLVVDIGLTVWGWRPIVIPWLIGLLGKALIAVQLQGAPPSLLLGAAYLLAIVVALLFALLPERGLVRG